ncbi:hypothetical protein A2T76_23255 [Pseudomonas brenneri]|nr:hypothetical protein A2T76_23255 [Pseudomonas brenneri]
MTAHQVEIFLGEVFADHLGGGFAVEQQRDVQFPVAQPIPKISGRGLYDAQADSRVGGCQSGQEWDDQYIGARVGHAYDDFSFGKIRIFMYFFVGHFGHAQ